MRADHMATSAIHAIGTELAAIGRGPRNLWPRPVAGTPGSP
jgi:hypothetical protein